MEMSVGLGPQPVAMEERRTVTLAECHRAELQPRDAGGPKRVAVERRIGAGLRQRPRPANQKVTTGLLMRPTELLKCLDQILEPTDDHEHPTRIY